jgi:hypothetical protein
MHTSAPASVSQRAIDALLRGETTHIMARGNPRHDARARRIARNRCDAHRIRAQGRYAIIEASPKNNSMIIPIERHCARLRR